MQTPFTGVELYCFPHAEERLTAISASIFITFVAENRFLTIAKHPPFNINIWEYPSLRYITRITRYPISTVVVPFQDSTRLAIFNNRTIHVHDYESNELLWMTPITEDVQPIFTTFRNNRILFITRQYKITLCDITRTKSLDTTDCTSTSTTKIIRFSDTEFITSCLTNVTFYEIEASTIVKTWSKKYAPQPSFSVCVSPTSVIVLSKNQIEKIDPRLGTTTVVYSVYGLPFRGVDPYAFTSHGNIYITGNSLNDRYIIDVEKEQYFIDKRASAMFASACMSPQGTSILSVGYDSVFKYPIRKFMTTSEMETKNRYLEQLLGNDFKDLEIVSYLDVVEPPRKRIKLR